MPAAPTPPASAPAVDFAALEAAMEARRRDYLVQAARGSSGGAEGYYTQIARLETGIGPLDLTPLEDLMDFMDARRDTADFKCTALLRLLYLHGQNPMLPQSIRQRARRTLLDFKYWIDEPGKDEMVFWSENHFILFSSCEYLAGQLYPGETFSNDGRSGDEHRQKARPRILRWLDERLRFGFAEWYSPVYYPHDVAPLMNLVDFAADPEIRSRAAMVLDLLLLDLARLTQKGSFGLTAGRAYEEHKWTGHRQSIGDLIEILFATRGSYRSRGATAATSFASSRNYRVPHVLLGIGRDEPTRFVDRARMSISFGEASLQGIGFQDFSDGMFWWGCGAYTAPETILLTRRMVETWDLWHYSYFQPLQALRFIPDALLPSLSSALSPLSEGSALSDANLVCYRSPDGMLSSVQSYRRGQVGFQQHAWQATFDLDAVVWTTSPGTLGRQGPGEWTGSGSMPRVIQSEDVAIILYNPALSQRLLFPAETHAYFPKSAFDETVSRYRPVASRASTILMPSRPSTTPPSISASPGPRCITTRSPERGAATGSEPRC